MQERRIQIRLNQEDVKLLENIKQVTGNSTFAGAMRYAMKSFEEVQKRYDMLLKEHTKQTIEYRKYKLSVSQIIKMADELKKIEL